MYFCALNLLKIGWLQNTFVLLLFFLFFWPNLCIPDFLIQVFSWAIVDVHAMCFCHCETSEILLSFQPRMPHEKSSLPARGNGQMSWFAFVWLGCQDYRLGVERDDGKWWWWWCQIFSPCSDNNDIIPVVHGFVGQCGANISLRVKGWLYMYLALPSSYSNCQCFNQYCSILHPLLLLEYCYMW